MKLDFDETEDKKEIEQAELLKKIKNLNITIDSQAIVAKEMKDKISNLNNEVFKLRNQLKDANERILELESINSALDNIKNYKKQINETLQNNMNALRDNKKIQFELNTSIKQVSSEINEQIGDVNFQIENTINKSIKSFGSTLLRHDIVYWLYIGVFLFSTGFFIKYVSDTNGRLEEANLYIKQIDETMRRQKFYWYDEENGNLYFKTKNEIEQQKKK